MNVNVKIIPHKDQRYETCGDWWFEANYSPENQLLGYTLQIRVSELGDGYMEFCIAVHEQIEAMLCFMRGISEESVSEFDKQYEKFRAMTFEDYQGEPGDHPDAPYKNEHFFATTIERLIAAELKIDWGQYDAKVSSL